MEKAAEENLERLEQHRAAVKARLRLGVVTRPDVYRVEAELSSAQADLTDARNARYLAESSLGRAVGLEGGFSLVSPDTMEITPLAAASLAQLQHQALRQRADLKAGRVAEKMAQSQIKLEKSAYWPTVSLEGGYTSTEADPEVFAPEDESIYGSVMVNVPIFDGGLRKANTGTARAELEKARLGRASLEKDIRVEVEQAWRELFSKLERRNALADKLRFAGENFNAVSKQFDNGLATSIDRIDANTLYTQAAKELAAAEYACAVAGLRLEKAAGTFLETVMGVLDNT
ncbi:MAG: TolC family protein [Thermodesulfobacteriota bacterium]|nr:TolC family protein [Thermodesulfobacteriota bacterium]